MKIYDGIVFDDPFHITGSKCKVIKAEDLENEQIIIKCKECKHWLADVPGCTEYVKRCEWANWMVGENGFCVYGERR